MMAGISTKSVSTQEYLSSYYDMVARPMINDKKIYRRVFIKRKDDK